MLYYIQMQTPAPQHLRFAVLASDIALFTIKDKELLVRLIRVQRPPHFPDNPGLPGGILDAKETAEEAARRHIESKAKISSDKIYFEQLYTFSGVNRDRRNRVVAVAYTGFVPWEKLSLDERENTKEVYWQPVRQAKHLAYDHDEMLKVAVERLRSRVHYTTLMQKLVPREFTLTELEQAYESVSGTPLDKRNFRKKILKLDILTALEAKKTGGRFRPAQLYRFASARVDEIEIL